jgi:DNA-directed RNA polymerase I and III subunit RPAC1
VCVVVICFCVSSFLCDRLACASEFPKNLFVSEVLHTIQTMVMMIGGQTPNSLVCIIKGIVVYLATVPLTPYQLASARFCHYDDREGRVQSVGKWIGLSVWYPRGGFSHDTRRVFGQVSVSQVPCLRLFCFSNCISFPLLVGLMSSNVLSFYRKNFRINVLERPSPNDLVFELINVDASFANALRRILLAEVPTVAIEKVYMWNNSSIIHDEVLAHRMGLIPIQADPRYLEPFEEDDEPTERNTLVFRLMVSCKHSERDKTVTKLDYEEEDEEEEEEPMDRLVKEDDPDLVDAAMAAATTRPYKFPRDRPYTKHVYSSDIEWMPQGDQEERLGSAGPVHDDILIAKLRPGQVIELEAHARVGTGKDHAKFSPVSTASYRLLPHVVLKEPVYDEVAKELAHVYEPGVFRLEKTDPKVDPPNTKIKAVVDNPYACTMSRNFMRHPVLAKAVEITRKPNHYIFSVESVGMYSPAVLVAEALRTLQRKCQRIMDLAEQASSPDPIRMDMS